MVTPNVRMVKHDDIEFARAWLAKYAPDVARRSWIDVEHAMLEHFPGGMAMWLYRTSNRIEQYAP